MYSKVTSVNNNLADNARFTISELAERTGLTRRVVRFYVQRGLIPPPKGRGRGSHYAGVHLERIMQIQEWQAAGHSLEEIKVLLEFGADRSNTPEPVSKSAPRHVQSRARARSRIKAGSQGSAELWARVEVLPGVELHIDLDKYRMEPAVLKSLKEKVSKELRKHGIDTDVT